MSQLMIFLLAAVLAVPLARRFGLGAILGYLLAGILIGPGVLGWVSSVDETQHVAELGVMLLLFVIGLELSPRRLWTMRRLVLGAGGVQFVVTALVLLLIAIAFDVAPLAAVICGLALALSSTALALQVLAESKAVGTRYGRVAFAILLFQDIAVIPVLALLPSLGDSTLPGNGFDWLAALLIVSAVGVGGRFVLRPALRLVASLGTQESFTAAALLVAVGTAWLMSLAGLSPALGAFVAGMLLADSEYRHALEADIQPFKGLLLGLFFISVGMGVDVDLLIGSPATLLAGAVALVVIKAGLLFGVGLLNKLTMVDALRLGAVASQGGEFAFVLLGVATAVGVVPANTAAMLVLVVSLSMLLTPMLCKLVDALAQGAEKTDRDKPDRDFDTPDEHHSVVIAGFGRFGQIVGRVLQARGIAFTALDASIDHIDFVRRFGSAVHYGDASRLDLLRAAGLEQADVLVIAISDPEASLKIVDLIHEHFPHVEVLARAVDRRHAYKLLAKGVKRVVRETYHSSARMAEYTLQATGLADSEASRLVQQFKKLDERRLRSDFHDHDDEKRMLHLAQTSRQELEEMFARDKDLHSK
jgi:monovalent cation:proton antiporter-2 (CPA2) family protein